MVDLLFIENKQGARGRDEQAQAPQAGIPFSLCPDYTVGPGITPGLLTSPKRALAG
jgi:hypothetical protein